MKIQKFNQLNEELYINPRYEIREMHGGNGWYTVPPIEDDGNGEFNYEEYDLKSVVSYLIECVDNHSGKLEIYKITDSLVSEDIINKVKEEIKLDNDTKKYNL